MKKGRKYIGKGGMGRSRRDTSDTASRMFTGRGGEQFNSERRFFEAIVNHQDGEVRSFRDAMRFVAAMDTFTDKTDLLTKLDDSRKYGAIRIHDVLAFIGDSMDVENILIPLLKSVINDATSRPLAVATLENSSADILCQFLLEISKAFVEPKESESVKTLALELRQRGGVRDIVPLCFILCVDEQPKDLDYASAQYRADPVAWGNDFNPPGGRHDNDFFNFRMCQVVPTLDEIRCDTPSFLPLASQANKVIEDPEHRLLDSNFRLLREDSVQTMKEKISGNQVRLWKHARVVGLHYKGNAYNSKTICTLSFMIQFSGERKKMDWERSKALSYGSVIALCRDGHPMRLGKISMRDATTRNAWLNATGGPIIGVVIESQAEFAASFRELWVNSVRNRKFCEDSGCIEVKDGNNVQMQLKRDNLLNEMETYDLIEISQSFSTSQPVLLSLQSMDRIPLSEELVYYNGAKVDYLPDHLRMPDDKSFRGLIYDLNNWNSNVVAESTSLDLSQAEALHHAFSSRVGLIQGPPGTGKTFIGGAIARIIRENTDECILCVCYTNHALDQFLEHMLDAGENRIVRIGGRSRSARIEPYRLKELSRRQTKDTDLTSVLRRVDAKLYAQHEIMEERALILQKPVEWTSPLGGIQGLLRKGRPEFCEFLSVPELLDGFSLVGSDNRKMSKSFFFNTWKSGKSIPEWLDPYFPHKTHSFKAFWNMSSVDRLALLEGWTVELLQHEVNALFAVINEYNELMAEKELIKRAIDGQILDHARVIGATTTGAAQYREVLSERAAGVVIVEEAGEVLEAHVLSSLSVATKHLILIGDHKQLRPKTETYELTTVAERGYNLDRSLFERLVLSRLPATSLKVQHRMRPGISDFVRSQTYPQLLDHESVLGRPNINGVSMNVAFIHHDVNEDGHNRDDHNAQTKSNTFEAEFCIEIVRYLLLQGYKPRDIVVLTPYVGQLAMITRCIKENLKEVTAFVSDRDAVAIDLLGIEGETQEDIIHDGHASKEVRCSSIDNFQGEEALIVVVSLVRSNASGTIGFLKEPQRVNVLLSRARDGMFLVGNKNTLTLKAGKAVWNPILDIMRDRGQIQKGFPSVCQLHPEDDPIFLKTSRDFRTLRPNGGCDRRCVFRMQCGHACPKMCHPSDRDHRVGEKECCKPCRRFPPECNLRHMCTKLCSQDCGSCKELVGPITLLCGHVVDRVSCHDVRNAEALDKFSKRCLAPTEHTFLTCGHVFETTCANSRSNIQLCPSSCNALLGCGHRCSNDCGKCNLGHSCEKTCGRSLFCSHLCGKPCHGEKACEPCKEKCRRACSHSECPRRCCDPCSACVEPCDWNCEHEGQCLLVCGAPCSRLPCNERCNRQLPCGHQCPSLCGEKCPSAEHCQICGNRRGDTPDMLQFQRYDEIDLSEDPIIALQCRHFFTISTLDGLFDMEAIYELDARGKAIGLRQGDSTISDRHILCPECRMPIQSINRYGRILKLSELRALERKHMMAINQMLQVATRTKVERRIGVLERIELQIHRSPMMVVWEASGVSSDAHETRPPSAQHIQIFSLLAGAHESMISVSDDNSFQRSIGYYQKGIQLSSETMSILSSARLRIGLASLMVRWRNHSEELIAEVRDLLDWVFQQDHLHDLKETARTLLDNLLLTHEKRELAEVVAAMNVVDGYDYGGSWIDHWYQCPNGHPYFIGHCGAAMLVSRCIECGLEIGGLSHVLLSSNQRITGVVADILMGTPP